MAHPYGMDPDFSRDDNEIVKIRDLGPEEIASSPAKNRQPPKN